MASLKNCLESINWKIPEALGSWQFMWLINVEELELESDLLGGHHNLADTEPCSRDCLTDSHLMQFGSCDAVKLAVVNGPARRRPPNASPQSYLKQQ